MGCSLFLDKMVEEPPAPKLQKPQQILACVFFDMFPFFCWLPSQSLTFDSWCISSCHMCCVKLWILARCPQCLGLRRQVAMPMPGWCCFFSVLPMVPWCSKTGMILCPKVFCPGICWAPWKNSAITVKSQGAVRSENYRHKLVNRNVAATDTSPPRPCWKRNRSSEGRQEVPVKEHQKDPKVAGWGLGKVCTTSRFPGLAQARAGRAGVMKFPKFM